MSMSRLVRIALGATVAFGLAAAPLAIDFASGKITTKSADARGWGYNKAAGGGGGGGGNSKSSGS